MNVNENSSEYDLSDSDWQVKVNDEMTQFEM